LLAGLVLVDDQPRLGVGADQFALVGVGHAVESHGPVELRLFPTDVHSLSPPNNVLSRLSSVAALLHSTEATTSHSCPIQGLSSIRLSGSAARRRASSEAMRIWSGSRVGIVSARSIIRTGLLPQPDHRGGSACEE